MKSISESASIDLDQRIKILIEASGGVWYNGWKPYCLQCSFNGRMKQTSFGFICTKCKNIIGWDLVRLKESPFNY